MNKQELIEKVVKDTGATKALAGKVLESAIENIGKTLKKGDTITFVGFGTFKTSVRKARTARNPRTGEPIKIAKRRVPRFTRRQGPQGPRQVDLGLRAGRLSGPRPGGALPRRGRVLWLRRAGALTPARTRCYTRGSGTSCLVAT